MAKETSERLCGSTRAICSGTISVGLWIDWCIIIIMNAHSRRKIAHLEVPEF
jgi:hypothetical protein